MFRKSFLLSFFTIAFVFPAALFSQYDITLKVKNASDSMIVLGYYFGKTTYALDTAYSKKGEFRFKGDKILEPGIYFFTNLADHFCEFLIDNESTAIFSTQDDQWIPNMHVKGSKTNEVYYEYLKKSTVYGDAYAKLKDEKPTLPDSLLVAKQDSIKRLLDGLKKEFMHKYPDNLLSKILKAGLEIDLPTFPMIKKTDGTDDSTAWRQKNYQYYLHHFFDNIDFSCNGLLRTPEPVFHRRFNSYWKDMLVYQPSDSIISYAVKWIEKARGNSKMFQFFVHTITEYYLQSAAMGHDAIYVYMIQHYYANGDAFWMSPSGINAEVERAGKWENSLIGKVVPDLSCPDSNNVFHNLYSLKKDFVVFIIWSPDCGHCATEVPILRDFYNEHKEKYNLEVFAINSDEKIEEWKTFCKEKYLPWINLNGLVANFNWRDYFDIKTTPFVLILDKDKRIVAKRPQMSHLGELLDAIKAGKLLH